PRRRAARRPLGPARARVAVRARGRRQRPRRRRALDRAPLAHDRQRGERVNATLLQFARLQIHHRSGKPDCFERDGICPQWIFDTFGRYRHPLWQQFVLVIVSVAIGFVIAFALALVAHRRRALVAPIVQVTGILYTLPSIAVFFLLLPITG